MNRKVYIVFIFILYMNKKTTIQIEHKTLERLKKLRITKRDTYEEILNRLVDMKENKKEF